MALAEALYGGERKIITINMSEYQEPHSVSGLKGAPPGYVGYGEGGVITEAVRRAPYSVVLLDEVEKAHADVLELFFQVFDKGGLEDGEGREVDFRNTTIILTSNVASSKIMHACLNCEIDNRPSEKDIDELIRPILAQSFKPALLGRLKVVPFYPLPDSILKNVIKMKMNRITKRVMQQHHIRFDCHSSVFGQILPRCTEVDTVACNIDNIISSTILPKIADCVLAGMAKGQPLRSMRLSSASSGEFRYRLE